MVEVSCGSAFCALCSQAGINITLNLTVGGARGVMKRRKLKRHIFKASCGGSVGSSPTITLNCHTFENRVGSPFLDLDSDCPRPAVQPSQWRRVMANL